MRGSLARGVVVTLITLAAALAGATVSRAAPFAYLGSSGASQFVTVVDVATSAIVTTIQAGPFGFTFQGIALSPTGHRVYVSGGNAFVGANRVFVIDATTNTFLGEIPANVDRGLAINSAGTRLYGASGDNSVYVIDTSTNAVVASIPVAGGPWGVVVSPDGSRVYTTTLTTDTVTIIDTATNAVIGSVALAPSSAPKGLAINPTGTRLYVTRSNLNGVTVVDTTTATVVTTITGIGNGPSRIAVNPAGTRAYAACEAGNLFVIDTASNTIAANVSVSVNGGVGVTPDGTKIYALKGNSPPQITVLDATTHATIGTITGMPAANAMGLFIGPACPAACNDGNDCTIDGCNIVGGCTSTNASPGAACTDGLFCTGADTCDGSGGCTNHPGDPCLGGPECADTCDETNDTCNEPSGTACTSDGNGCTDDECNGAGVCAHPANSAPCDDLLYCNGTDQCGGTTCSVHTGDPCAGGPDCADVCDDTNDTCNEPSGTACASDGNVCTVDQCDGAGACTHPAGNSGALCRADAGDCDVAETCNGASPTCPADAFEPNGTGCSDGNGCTIDDACLGGVCVGDPMTCGDGIVQGDCTEECDDGNVNVDDGCDATCQLEPCEPAPNPSCRPPFVGAKSTIKIKDLSDGAKDAVQFKWSAGTATTKADFGNPVTSADYWFCLYDDGQLVSTTKIGFGGTCDGKPCWTDKPKGFAFKAKTPNGNGATQMSLASGVDGKAKIAFKGKGMNLAVPNTTAVSSELVAQVVKASDGTCWRATFTAPFKKQDAANLSDKAD